MILRADDCPPSLNYYAVSSFTENPRGILASELLKQFALLGETGVQCLLRHRKILFKTDL